MIGSILPWAIGIGVAIASGTAWYAYRRGNNSVKGNDQPSGTSVLDQTHSLSGMLGYKYAWSLGNPATTPEEAEANGTDCSGWAQVALVFLGLLSPSYKDRGARDLADDCDPVPFGEQTLGDLAIYPGHVMVVCSYPDPSGHSSVIGQSGGDSNTHGDDPNACVKIFAGENYRDDFVTFGRLKEGKH